MPNISSLVLYLNLKFQDRCDSVTGIMIIFITTLQSLRIFLSNISVPTVSDSDSLHCQFIAYKNTSNFSKMAIIFQPSKKKKYLNLEWTRCSSRRLVSIKRCTKNHLDHLSAACNEKNPLSLSPQMPLIYSSQQSSNEQKFTPRHKSEILDFNCLTIQQRTQWHKRDINQNLLINHQFSLKFIQINLKLLLHSFDVLNFDD